MKQRKLGPELWHDVVLQEVEELPSAIDGISAFEFANVEKKELHNALKDGRRWKKNCPTKWKGHAQVRYTDCRGSYMYTNEKYVYMSLLEACHAGQLVGGNGTVGLTECFYNNRGHAFADHTREQS